MWDVNDEHGEQSWRTWQKKVGTGLGVRQFLHVETWLSWETNKTNPSKSDFTTLATSSG